MKRSHLEKIANDIDDCLRYAGDKKARVTGGIASHDRAVFEIAPRPTNCQPAKLRKLLSGSLGYTCEVQERCGKFAVAVLDNHQPSQTRYKALA